MRPLLALAALLLAPSLALANPCGTKVRGTIILKGYEIGQTAIPEAERERLAQFADTAKARFSICVAASVDATGSDAANEQVSNARAATVIRFLTDRGVDPGAIQTANVESSEVTFFGLFKDDRNSERRVYVSHD